MRNSINDHTPREKEIECERVKKQPCISNETSIDCLFFTNVDEISFIFL